MVAAQIPGYRKQPFPPPNLNISTLLYMDLSKAPDVPHLFSALIPWNAAGCAIYDLIGSAWVSEYAILYFDPIRLESRKGIVSGFVWKNVWIWRNQAGFVTRWYWKDTDAEEAVWWYCIVEITEQLIDIGCSRKTVMKDIWKNTQLFSDISMALSKGIDRLSITGLIGSAGASLVAGLVNRFWSTGRRRGQRWRRGS